MVGNIQREWNGALGFPGFVVVSGNVAVLEGEQASVFSSPGLFLGLASDLDWHQNARRIHPADPRSFGLVTRSFCLLTFLRKVKPILHIMVSLFLSHSTNNFKRFLKGKT